MLQSPHATKSDGIFILPGVTRKEAGKTIDQSQRKNNDAWDGGGGGGGEFDHIKLAIKKAANAALIISQGRVNIEYPNPSPFVE